MKAHKINFKKLTIAITVVNLLGWALLELWNYRYAGTKMDSGAFWLTLFHLLAYYIIIVNCYIPKNEPEKPEVQYKPHNCPGHDWQPHKYGGGSEQCIICGAERGKSKTF